MFFATLTKKRETKTPNILSFPPANPLDKITQSLWFVVCSKQEGKQWSWNGNATSYIEQIDRSINGLKLWLLVVQETDWNEVVGFRHKVTAWSVEQKLMLDLLLCFSVQTEKRLVQFCETKDQIKILSGLVKLTQHLSSQKGAKTPSSTDHYFTYTTAA